MKEIKIEKFYTEKEYNELKIYCVKMSKKFKHCNDEIDKLNEAKEYYKKGMYESMNKYDRVRREFNDYQYEMNEKMNTGKTISHTLTHIAPIIAMIFITIFSLMEGYYNVAMTIIIFGILYRLLSETND